MQEELLEVLAEPRTGASLRLKDAKTVGGRIEQGQLVSEASGRSYPIVRGIPRFVETEGYTGSFGMQWNRFREVQIDTSTGHSDSQRRFDYETTWTENDLKGRWVLDGGCGAGRFAEVAAARGPRLVAMDFSSAIDAAAKTVERFSNVNLVQGNLLEPPFKPGAFDFVYSIGVVQHTPDPPAVLRNLVGVTRPGGRFSMSIYARRPWTKLNTKYLIRPLTRRLPQETLLRAIERVMPFVFPVTDRLFRMPVVGRLAKFTIPVATYDRGDFDREQRYQEAVLDTFDMLSPRYDSPMTWQEVEAVFRKAGVRSWRFIEKVPIYVVGDR
jgi:SAM-dependent methyltransferase